jgi:hypothetical protein
LTQKQMSTELSGQRSDSLSGAADALLPWSAVVPAAALAVFLGRGLAPALPGMRSGIEIWITRIETGTSTVPALGAWLTQLTLLSTSWLCMHFSLLLLGQRTLQAPLRLLATVLGAALFAIVALANVAQGRLGHPWLVAGATSALLLAAVAALRALQHPTTRAAGIVLLGTALSGALQLGSRVLALQASSRARATDFMIARGCASAALVVTLGTLLFALYWLWANDRKRQLALTPLALLPAVLVIAAALAGAGEGGAWWQQVAARTLSELRTHPDPLVLVPVRDSIELFTLFVGVLMLTRANTPQAVSAVVGLALISRGNVDIPLCALLLGCAALLCLTLTVAAPRGGSSMGSKREQSRPADPAGPEPAQTTEPAAATKIGATGYP